MKGGSYYTQYIIKSHESLSNHILTRYTLFSSGKYGCAHELYSIRIEMQSVNEDRLLSCEVYEIKNAFADVGKAIVLFERLLRDGATVDELRKIAGEGIYN